MNEYKTIYINGEPTKYVINTHGDIINTDRNRHVKCAIDKRYGRRFASLSHKGIVYKHWLARWILMTFKPLPISEYMFYEVDHIDGDRTHDELNNLQWLTRKENITKSMTVDNNNGIGESNNNAKITNDIAKKICELISTGYSDKQISNNLNVSVDIIQRIKRGEAWTHIASEYDLHKYIKTRKPYTYYSPEYKRHICDLLYNNPTLTPKKLANIMGVKYDTKFTCLFYILKRSMQNMKEKFNDYPIGGEIPQQE